MKLLCLVGGLTYRVCALTASGRTFFVLKFNLSAVIRRLVGSEPHCPYFCHYCEHNYMEVWRKKTSCGVWFEDDLMKTDQTQLMLGFCCKLLWSAHNVIWETMQCVCLKKPTKNQTKTQKGNKLLILIGHKIDISVPCRFFRMILLYAIWCNFGSCWGDVSSKPLHSVFCFPLFHLWLTVPPRNNNGKFMRSIPKWFRKDFHEIR